MVAFIENSASRLCVFGIGGCEPPQPVFLLIPKGFPQNVSFCQLHAIRHGNQLATARFLANAIAAEQKTGAEFMDKYYGHRALTDSFMEFFGEALHSQWAYNNSKGWPQNLPHYGPCLILYLTVYRSIRSSEVLSANGYVLAAYAVQRTIKDQLMVLDAAASGFADFSELFGRKEYRGRTGPKRKKSN